MNEEREIALVNSEVECKRLRFALEGIADPAQFLSLDLNLKKSNLSLQEWAKAVISNTLKWDRGFMVIIERKNDMKVRYDGCTDDQANYGGGADPRNFLQKGGVYELERQEVHPWHTLYYLQGYSKPFNSVCFSKF